MMENKQQRKPDVLDMRRGELPPGELADGKAQAAPRRQKAHQKAITNGLRKFFDEVAAEPVPDEFLALLKKMDEQ